MFRNYLLLLILISAQLLVQGSTVSTRLHHKVTAKLNIDAHTIAVVDSIKLPDSGSDISFTLNNRIELEEVNAKLEVVNKDGINQYILKSMPANNWLVVNYTAFFLSDQNSTIDTMGVYISAEDHWMPMLSGSELFTFDLQLKLPRQWSGVTNGQQLRFDEKANIFYFSSADPTNQIIITANKWIKYTRPIAGVHISVFLINPDEALAQKYLGVTGQYLKMYSERIGPFPYSKFDVVENFRETGFGLPSFTLLGQKVMRFPWILFTSYPHELLHNYWGNGVYVDYEKGNWCEGITTYMADLMLKEQKAEDKGFRRDQLQKYTNYVNDDNDFPAREFLSKFDNVSEAVGYSKVVMLNQMLRTEFGDEIFFNAYSNFYKENKFKRASFDDIQRAFEKEIGHDLEIFFNQWLDRTGAPEIVVNDMVIKKKSGSWELSCELQQMGSGEPYQLNIPIQITFDKDGNVMNGSVKMFKKKQTFTFIYDKKPTRVEIDPNFEVMRKLSDEEVPPTLSKLMGNKKWTIVLPSESKILDGYRSFAQAWKGMYGRRGFVMDIVEDVAVKKLQSGQTIWILGKENKHRIKANVHKTYGEYLNNDFYGDLERVEQEGVYVYSIINSENNNVVGVINAQSATQLMSLMKKMMHYGNNSYIGFEGEDMKNTLKGQFPVINSPLVKELN